MSGNLAASIHARLLNRAKARGEEFNLVLTRYAIERFLYRLSTLPARESFCLKGALLFDLWFDIPHRPTHDADFLGYGLQDAEVLAATMRQICVVDCDDGMIFDAATITVGEIREEARYGGLRVRLTGKLGKARSTVQIDVGYGDAVSPAPEDAVFPVMLPDLPPPRLRVYPRATVIAEKLEAIENLGMTNSRMKDFFDICVLAREGTLGNAQLGDAIAATFERRGTPIPAGVPLGLSDEFAQDAVKRAQWLGFIRKNRLGELALEDVIRDVRRFVEAPMAHARKVLER